MALPVIDVTFFIRDINIPNTGKSEISDRINLFIGKYTSECLKGILGYALYNTVSTEDSQRITDLVNGAEYLDLNGDLQNWEGLVHDDNISLIANYIYYFYQRNNATQTTQVAVANMKTEAGTSVSVSRKTTDAWNFFSRETKSMLLFLWTKNNTPNVDKVYPEFSNNQYFVTKEFSRTTNEFGL